MQYLYPYIPVVMVLLVAGGFGVANLLLGHFIGPHRFNPSKMQAYESGMTPIGEANVRIPIKFYMVAILFLLFDIESIYMLSWAVIFRGQQFKFQTIQEGLPKLDFTLGQFQRFSFVEMLTFILILLVGYIYVWRKGGFRWS